ncbi:MAG: glycosyltransferase family 2 protein [Oscillospiraceae bacterium]|nr:glycosyltransferase family 2 protein [Oscillospiraceae bacterium]
MKNVCAGVVLYNPSIERLKGSIDAVRPQVDRLVFVDNASENVDELQKLLDPERDVLIKNEANLGIAKALNQLVEFADTNSYEWILTLDQDSICAGDHVEKLLTTATTDNKIAMAAPLIIDRGIVDVDNSPKEGFPDTEDVKWCITSGNLTNVKAVLGTGGFNEWLFIDEVDLEMSLRLLREGYRLVRVNTAVLNHEYGLKTIRRRFLWRVVTYRNYAPIRVYYQHRNIVYMLRKYGREYVPSPFVRWVKLFTAFTMKFIFEPERFKRLSAFTRGIAAGLVVNIKEK